MPIFKGTWKDGEGVGFDADSFAIHKVTPLSRDLYMWWPDGPPWDMQVPVDVTHAGGTDTVVVNQEANPGQWNLLGTWDFNTLTSTITIRTTDTITHVAADAVAVVPAGDTPLGQITVDNVAASFVGAWTLSTFRPNYWAPNYRHDQNADKGNKTCTFTPTIPVFGSYRLFMWWPQGPPWDTAVPVDVNHGGATDTVKVDQSANAGQWNLLGTYTFQPGTSDTIVIRTDGTTAHVAADAIRLMPVGQVGPHQYIDNADGEPFVTIVGDWLLTQFRQKHWALNYLHDRNLDKGNKSVRFTATHNIGGRCRLRIHGRRAGSGVRPGYYPAGPKWEAGYYPMSPWVWNCRQGFAETVKLFATFPPFAPLIVTGVILPLLYGVYGGVGFHNTKGHWYNQQVATHIWWDSDFSVWYVASFFPESPINGDPYWFRADPAPFGPYEPMQGAIGILIASSPQ